MNTAPEKTGPVWVAGFMSGTSLDGVDAAMICTDGHQVAEFGPVAERGFTPAERRVLQEAVDAARRWNWQGPRPESIFRAACEVLTCTHLEAWRALVDRIGGPVPVLAGVHGQTVLHRRARGGQSGQTLQLVDAPALAAGFGVPVVHDFRTADVCAGGTCLS